jgi:FkbM family methyltransferase
VISYAQNCEDVLLARAFRGQAKGFYVDLGAAHPEIDSVTKYFYDLGWYGINVEPNREYFTLLQAERSRDINLKLAVSNFSGEARLFKIPPYYGLSSLNDAVLRLGERLPQSQQSDERVMVDTLAHICDQYVNVLVDFLKIDVEGAEKSVLEGADFSRFRPRVIVIEATQPMSETETYNSWEGILLQNGYRFVYFDGLNRFYIRSEEPPLQEAFRSPANVFDNFKRRDLFEAERRVDELEKILQKIGDQYGVSEKLDEKLGELNKLQSMYDEAQKLIGELKMKVGGGHIQLDRAERALLETKMGKNKLGALVRSCRRFCRATFRGSRSNC